MINKRSEETQCGGEGKKKGGGVRKRCRDMESDKYRWMLREKRERWELIRETNDVRTKCRWAYIARINIKYTVVY